MAYFLDNSTYEMMIWSISRSRNCTVDCFFLVDLLVNDKLLKLMYNITEEYSE